MKMCLWEKAWVSKWKHEIELNTEEQQHLQEEQQKTLPDDQLSDEDEVRESVQSSLIKEMCAKWVEVQLFVERYHPDTMLANRAVYIFNDNAMKHFSKTLQHRQKQLTLDKFLVKKARKTTTEEEESRASKRQRREKTLKGELPCLFMEGDSHIKGT